MRFKNKQRNADKEFYKYGFDRFLRRQLENCYFTKAERQIPYTNLAERQIPYTNLKDLKAPLAWRFLQYNVMRNNIYLAIYFLNRM